MPQNNPFASVRGPVRRVEEVQDADGSRTVTEYDREGRITLWENHRPGHPESRNSTYFDASGRMTGSESEYGEGKRSISRYIYDDGKLVRIEGQNPDGSAAQPILVEHKPDGGRIQTVPLADLPKTFEGREVGYDISVAVPGAATRTEEYDLAGRLTVTSFHDKDGKLLSATQYVYDNAGRLIVEDQSWDGANLIFEKLRSQVPAEVMSALDSVFSKEQGRRVTYRYDEAGREIEQHSVFPPMIDTTVRSEYNQHGDITLHTVESADRGFRGGTSGLTQTEEPSTPSVTECEYQYDDRDNWIRRASRTYSRGNESEAHESISTRLIEYYD